MAAVLLGVRHHSPACARLVAATIERLRPAYVLVEGPSDMNDRLDELFLGHDLPIAIYTSYHDGRRGHASWTPLCGYSPEWVALATGRSVGAQLRLIDLPAWHPALAGRHNRYADAERRHARAVQLLCCRFAVDTVDALWDHLFELPPAERLAERLAAYFDLLRGQAAAGPADALREAYMAGWVLAAVAEAGRRPVVVVTGGFHRPALVRLTDPADGPGTAVDPPGWPGVPARPPEASGGSYLVPFSFRRLDAFDGYQAGMPSPGYYQALWERGPVAAAQALTGAVTARLRAGRQPVSTADLVAAEATARALAAARGHPCPGRVDTLDGLASALIGEALDAPLPWTTGGAARAGGHPVVAELVAAARGSAVGRLHPGTPLPPLVHATTAELRGAGLAEPGPRLFDLADPRDLDRSRMLHRLRVLAVPGYTRVSGPAAGTDPTVTERWTLRADDRALPALIEAAGHGGTLADAAASVLADRIARAGGEVRDLAAALLDAALCGVSELPGRVLGAIGATVAGARDLAAVGTVLATTLALWRHGQLLGTAGSTPLGAAVAGAARRVLWLAEGERGTPSGGTPRAGALVAVRDALVHAAAALDIDTDAALAAATRVAGDGAAPPDLRGAAFGLTWSLSGSGAGERRSRSGLDTGGRRSRPGLDTGGREALPDPLRAVRGACAPGTWGDWLGGLFAVAREQVLAAGGVLDLLDDLLGAMTWHEFLVALPALRQAFGYFPPREREIIAARLLERRRLAGSGRSLLRLAAPAEVAAEGRRLDGRTGALLRREGLVGP